MTVYFRIPAMLGIVVALAVAVAVSGSGSASVPSIQGDANCNGAVGADDALLVLVTMTESALTGRDCVQASGDTECDGDGDEQDALSILSYVAQQPDTTATGVGCTPIGDPLATSGISPSATPTSTAANTVAATSTLAPTPTPTATPSVCVLPPADVVIGGATPATNGYTMTLLPADAGVDKLTNVVPVPGDSGFAIITSEPGRIWTICLGDGRARQQIGNLTNVVRDKKTETEETDEGLTSFVFEPGNPSVVYVMYSTPPYGSTFPTPEYLVGTATPGPRTVRSRLSRFQINNGTIERNSEEVILEIFQTYKWHGGESLAFGPDGMLYISSGDSGFAAHGQSLDDLYAAVVRIDVHSAAPYAVPSDNPFYGDDGKADEIWAYGLRNAWRFTFDGDVMWITDVGESAYEEVNIGKKGGNYGWDIMEGYVCTPASNPPLDCNDGALETPRAVIAHGQDDCVISGGYVYHGSAMPELEGYYIYGDWCSGRIWALDTANDQSAPIQLADTNLHPVSWAITNDGEVIAVSYYDSAHSTQFGTPPAGALPGIYRLERLP